MEKFNNKTAIWGEQNEKYLRSVVLYADEEHNDYHLYTTPEFVEENRISGEELYDLYMKNLIKIKMRPNIEEYCNASGINKRENGGYEVMAVVDMEGLIAIRFTSKELA